MGKTAADPLRSVGVSTVIVIDALDERKDDSSSRYLDSCFFNSITGRPEPWIKTGFRLPLLMDSTDVFILRDVHPALIATSDCSKFHRFYLM